MWLIATIFVSMRSPGRTHCASATRMLYQLKQIQPVGHCARLAKLKRFCCAISMRHGHSPNSTHKNTSQRVKKTLGTKTAEQVLLGIVTMGMTRHGHKTLPRRKPQHRQGSDLIMLLPLVSANKSADFSMWTGLQMVVTAQVETRPYACSKFNTQTQKK